MKLAQQACRSAGHPRGLSSLIFTVAFCAATATSFAQTGSGKPQSSSTIPAPVASPSGGSFDASDFPFEVTLTSAPGTTIRYTLANRDPDPKCVAGSASTNNKLYQGPIVIGNARKLRAVACSADNATSSPVATVHYSNAKKTATEAKAESFCFSPADNKNLPFRVLRNGAVPDDGEASDIYPVTEMTTGYHRVNPASTIPQYAYNGANRCHKIGGAVGDYDSCAGYVDSAGRRRRELRQNGTIPPYILPSGETVGVLFSTYHNADACTLAQAAAGLQYPDSKLDELTRATGLKVVKYNERDAKIPPLAASSAMMSDVCVLHAPYNAAMRGISLDYEVHDGRTPEMARRFLSSFADLVHAKGKVVLLRANPLTSPSQQINSGMKGNENYLQSIYDFVNIGVPRDANTPALVKKALTEQLDLLKHGSAPFSIDRVYVLARPGEINTPELAQAVREFVVANKIPMLAYGGTAVALGGSCDRPVNKVIRALVK